MKSVARVLVSLAAALAVGGCANLGVNPFPKDVDPGHGMKHGLDPFPDHAMNPRPTRSMNWTVFPKPKADSGRRIGLDPFPLGKDKVAAKACGGRCSVGCAMPCCAGKAAPAPKTISLMPKGGMASPAPAPAPVAAVPAVTTLLLKFEEGATRRYLMNMDTLMKAPVFGEDGMSMKMGMEMKQTMGKAREDGAAPVTSTIESVSMEVSNPMTGVLKVDTRDEASMKAAEENPMLGQMVSGLKMIVGKTMQVTISARGEVLETAGVDELMAGFGGGMGGGASGAQLTGLPAAFPAGPVHEGMSWPFEQSQPNPMGTMTTKGLMMVKSLDAATGLAVITLEGLIEVAPVENPDPDDMQAQMMAMIKIKNAKISGEIRFDTKGGFLRSSLTDMTMEMENPMVGDMTVDAKVTLSLVE